MVNQSLSSILIKTPTYLRVDEEEVHLEESEEGLEDGVRHQQVVHAPSLQRRVHGDLQSGEDQGAQPEHCKMEFSTGLP